MDGKRYKEYLEAKTLLEKIELAKETIKLFEADKSKKQSERRYNKLCLQQGMIPFEMETRGNIEFLKQTLSHRQYEQKELQLDNKEEINNLRRKLFWERKNLKTFII